MEKINKKKFRTAVNGYNKDDVTEYIRGLSKMITEAEWDSKEEIESLKKQIAELEEKLAAADMARIEAEEKAAKAEEAKKEEETEKGEETKKVEEPKKIEDAPRAPGRERRIRIAEETARAASTRRDREMIRVPAPGKAAEINKEVRQEPKKETKESGLPEDFDKYIENLRKSSAELLKEFDKMMEIGKNE
ncbi:MAG: hypothetical protein II736_02145 [Clostridia bacterium]|nr:hypothetical protein [Clostridia bacterium]